MVGDRGLWVCIGCGWVQSVESIHRDLCSAGGCKRFYLKHCLIYAMLSGILTGVRSNDVIFYGTLEKSNEHCNDPLRP